VSLPALVHSAESGYLKLWQQQHGVTGLSGETDKIYCMTAERTDKRSWTVAC